MARSTPRTPATQPRFVSCSENQPPAKGSTPNKRTTASRFRNVAGPSKNASSAVAHAAKKNRARAAAPKPKSKSEPMDVQMQMQMPAVGLPRPDGFAAEQVPREYQQDQLDAERPSLMWAVANSVTKKKHSLVFDKLPATIDLRVTSPNVVHHVSHTLAVYTAPSYSTQPIPRSESSFPPRQFASKAEKKAEAKAQRATPVHIFPIHAPLLTTTCTALPATVLPEAEVAEAFATELTTPVVPLAVPHAESFKHVYAFMYHHSPAHLLAALIPSTLNAAPSEEEPSSPTTTSTSTGLSVTAPAVDPILSTLLPAPTITPATIEARQAYAAGLAACASPIPTTTLLTHAHDIAGLWRTVRALGIDDAGLWAAMDAAWDIVFRALVFRGALPTTLPTA